MSKRNIDWGDYTQSYNLWWGIDTDDTQKEDMMLSDSKRLVIDIGRGIEITLDRKPYVGFYVCCAYLNGAEIFHIYEESQETAFRKCVGMLHGDLQMMLYHIDKYVADLDKNAPWLHAVPIEEAG